MALVAFLLFLSSDPVAEIDKLAGARDVDGLAKYASAQVVKDDDFRFLKRGGAYGVGESGWRALKLDDVDGSKSYVVFTTRLTCEDLGEQVFQLEDGKLTKKIPEIEDFGCRVKHWDLTVKFDRFKKTADIVAKTLFRSTKTGSFQVRLSPQYVVKSVEDASGKPVAFHQTAGTVSLVRPPTTDFVYTFHYAGSVNLRRFAGDMSDNEIMLTEDYWYPSIARGPATHTVAITTPRTWTVVAQGEKVSEESGADAKTTKFQMDVPCSYLSLAAGDYKTVSKSVEGIEYKVWSRVLSEDQMRTQLELQAPVIAFYNKTFGKMPFSGFGQLVTSLYSGGALEAYSFATYGPGWLPAEDAHEPAHTWFGGMLDNTYLKSFWNESFADWCDGYYHRHSPFGSVEDREKALVPTPFPNPEYWNATCQDSPADDGPSSSSLGYGKGAAVLEQMELEFPEMLDWIRQWVKERPEGRESEWTDFEHVCGPNAKWFFDQWIRRKGFPRLQISDVRYGNGAVLGHVAFQGAPYRLSLDVVFQKGKDYLPDRVFLNPDSLQECDFQIPLAWKPELVAFDPWQRLLVEHKGADRVTLSGFLSKAKFVSGPDASKWMATWDQFRNAKNATDKKPEEWSGSAYVGDPMSVPVLASALKDQGLLIVGEKAVYRGTEVDLNQGAVAAVLDLPNGGHCAFVMGRTKVAPNLGNARLGLFDGYGRLLRAKTDPVVQGDLAFPMK